MEHPQCSADCDTWHIPTKSTWGQPCAARRAQEEQCPVPQRQHAQEEALWDGHCKPCWIPERDALNLMKWMG